MVTEEKGALAETEANTEGQGQSLKHFGRLGGVRFKGYS